MSRGHGTSKFLHQFGGSFRRQRIVFQLRIERAAGAEFKREVRKPIALADLVNLNDVWVLQLRNCFGLQPEANPLLETGSARANHLQRDQAIESGLSRLVDDAHPATSEFVQDFECTDPLRSRQVGALVV